MSVWYSNGCGLGSCGHRRRGGLGTSGHRAEELARAFDWSHLQSNQPTAEVSVVLSQVLIVLENLCWPSVVFVSLCCRALRRFCCVLEPFLLWLSLAVTPEFPVLNTLRCCHRLKEEMGGLKR